MILRCNFSKKEEKFTTQAQFEFKLKYGVSVKIL